jgi:hypothetical protein
LTDATAIVAPVSIDVLLARINVADIYAPMMVRVREMLSLAQQQGADYYATSGYRGWEEQSALYAQGRITPSWNAASHPPLGTPVTKARAGYSSHNFCIAIDFTRDKDRDRRGLQPDHDMPAYRILAECAVKVGLESLYYSKDFPEGYHVQLPLESRGLSLALLREEYRKTPDKQAAMRRIRQILNLHGPW